MEFQNRATVVFTAQAFGYGPSSKCVAIADAINDKNIQKIFFGSDIALDLAHLHSFDQVYSLTNKNKILSILKKADVFVNVMDFELGNIAKLSQCSYILVDSLLYFWPKIPDGVKLADIYYCQNFFKTINKKIEQHGLINAQIIGPIVYSSFTCKEKRDQIIINFGGMENPHVKIGHDSNYPFVILKILLPILAKRFKNVLVVGRRPVMQMCQQQFIYPNVQFKMLDLKTMLEELHCSKAVFTTPGIQTFYDCADKAPIFLLPAQNSSNVRNSNTLVSQGIIEHHLNWEDLYGYKYKKSDNNCDIQKVLGMIKTFENNEKDQSVLTARVRKFLDEAYTWPSLISRQKKAFLSLGTNGVQIICNGIYNLLYGQKTNSFNDPRYLYLQGNHRELKLN